MVGYGDIIGAEDIIGYDVAGDDEIAALVGADIATGAYVATGAGAAPMVPARRAPAHPAATGRNAMLHALAQRHAAALTPRAFTKSREYTLGFSGSPSAIAGGATAVLKAQPQVPFKGRRLIIPSDVAGALIINNLIVGKNPVLVSADPVAARAYTELGVGVDLNMDTAQISQLISLSMTNTSGASVSVTPTLIGTAME
jgi:hypothetical protein